ncbi:GroES-like protein [Tilletiaria anomala UBC 951]|uniref:GroES-like protein n=1 Tax=Tilletiaria anomala (strain ATCC 24038 / CBS 436.72 / UBC 951) TaxID=1037660 RepID=A0A066VVA9_TILAU|nr:GroES-like protein [Tilletiaria anomala UBC 951]KDN42739.1 GroES-like protein [Tilletiaria anomala UBC 951]
MKALTWQSKHPLALKDVPGPTATEARVVIIKITATMICGSDLHLCGGNILQLKKECMGVFNDAGQAVKFSISCGECKFCKMNLNSVCERTNSSNGMDKLYDHTLKVPDGLLDERAFMLTDISCTSYHSRAENAAIWGAGPIGQHFVQWLQVFGAKGIILIDNVQTHLDYAKCTLNDVATHAGKAQIKTLNFNSKADCPRGQFLTKKLYELEPLGINVRFDEAGFRYERSIAHTAIRAVALKTDTPETRNECIQAIPKFVRISTAADCAGLGNGFNIGGLMEKCLNGFSNCHAPVQLYATEVLEKYINFSIDMFPKLYVAFNEKRFDEEHKPILK